MHWKGYAAAAIYIAVLLIGGAAFSTSSQGVTPGKLGPDAFAQRIAEDKGKFAEIVKRAGIEPQ